MCENEKWQCPDEFSPTHEFESEGGIVHTLCQPGEDYECPYYGWPCPGPELVKEEKD